MARAGPRKIARYGEQFNATAVKLSSLPGVLIQDVAAALDILLVLVPLLEILRQILHAIALTFQI